MSRPSRPPDREHTFRQLYGTTHPDLLRFVQRRACPDHAEDIVADTFLIVWRRLDELPRQHGDARAWIFGIARNLLLNNHRGEQRRRALRVRLTTAMTSSSSPLIDQVSEATARRMDLCNAWHRLSEVHQEALALAVFEELGSAQAAAVVGISPVAFRLRLSRARRALRLHLDHTSPQPPTPATINERTKL